MGKWFLTDISNRGPKISPTLMVKKRSFSRRWKIFIKLFRLYLLVLFATIHFIRRNLLKFADRLCIVSISTGAVFGICFIIDFIDWRDDFFFFYWSFLTIRARNLQRSVNNTRERILKPNPEVVRHRTRCTYYCLTNSDNNVNVTISTQIERCRECGVPDIARSLDNNTNYRPIINIIVRMHCNVYAGCPKARVFK